ncbi:MAG: PRC-barrel domain-containing protein, partial [Chloroflexia bacterium]|nr:PRC-barrel domain-containing protein [Chloroflexia bacterium]
MARQDSTDDPGQAERGGAAGMMPEAYLRRDHPLRFERNGIVYAADGRVGMLRQIVVDQDAGQVSELVIALDGTDESIVVPVSLVAKTGG